MIEEKIRFTVLRIKYEDRENDICRASVKVREGNNDRVTDIFYTYAILDLGKEYEALVSEELEDKAFRVKEIAGIYNVGTFVKEALLNDRKISNEVCENIVKRFGEQSVYLLVNNTEALTDLNIVSEDKSKYISEKAKKYAELLGLREYCKSNCIQSVIADKIYKKLGEKAIKKIQDNPFVLLSYEVNLRTVDKLANNLGVSYNDNNRVKYGVLEYLKHNAHAYGHVFIIQEELIENLNEYMNKNGGYTSNLTINKEQIIKAIGDLERDNEIIIYVNADKNKCVYLKELYECEYGVAEIISKLMFDKVEISEDIADKIDDLVNSYSKGNFKLTKQQGEAVKNAIEFRISILHGFPGTGKTQTLSSIVLCIKEIYKDSKIEVVAFTGKAVSRIKEILPEDVEAKTIHRLLELGVNRKMTTTCIDVDFLIIDKDNIT